MDDVMAVVPAPASIEARSAQGDAVDQPIDGAVDDGVNGAIDGGVDGAVDAMVTATLADFPDFYLAEYARVVRLMTMLTGQLAVAEELAQDAFVAAHNRWPVVGAYDDPGAWVRRVAVNRATSLRRRALTELRRRARLVARDAEEPPLPDAALWAAVRALPLRQRQVLAMVVLDDRPVGECAAVLGCGEATVRTHLHRARTTLANALGATVDGEPDRRQASR